METQNQNQNTTSKNSQFTEMFMLSAENFDNEKFYVVNFSGHEALNELFDFSINFVCSNKSLDTDFLMSCLTTFSIVRPNGKISNFTGYPINVGQSGHFGDYAYYHINLRPTFWKMTQLSASRIFLNKDLKEIITEILNEEKWLYFPNEFHFVKNDYPKQEFVMQYNETNFDFICWNLEQNGAYFYFDQDETNKNNISDKLVFCDQPSSHFSLNKTDKAEKLVYAEVSGLDFNHRQEIIYNFKLEQSPLPREVIVRDYDWKNPNRAIMGNANVSTKGLGTIYLSNENVESESEANRIAKIRAEELQCHSKTYYGKSVISTLRPGFTFELTDHYNQRFNQEYLLTKVHHEGCQESFLTLGLGIPVTINKSQNLVENNQTNQTETQNHYYYHNDFECIQANQVYRPKRTAPRAEIKGVIRGFIDAAGDVSRPEVDEFGRYKVIFPFDISGREKGKASCWIRRSQEQVGKGSGLNFPLLGGVEVTISFINGNPNLPIISGALANGESQSLAKNTNKDVEGIFTAGGNSLLFSNTNKKQGFALQTAAGRGLSVGAGSLSTTQMNADYAMGFFNTISTDIHGLASTNISGMKKFDYVGSPPSFTNFSDTKESWKPLIMGTVFKTIQEILSTFSKKAAGDGFERASSNINIGNAALKVIQSVVEKIPVWKIGKRTGNYSAMISTDKVSATSKLEALAYSEKDVIAWLTTTLVTSLLNSVVIEGVKDGTGISKSDDVKEAEEEFKKIGGGKSYGTVNDEYQAARKAKQQLEESKEAKAYAEAQKNQNKAEAEYEQAKKAQKRAEEEYNIALEESKKYPDNPEKQKILSSKKAALETANTDLTSKKNAYDQSVKNSQTAKIAYDAVRQKLEYDNKDKWKNKTLDEYLEETKHLYDLQKKIRDAKQAMAIKYVNSTITELLPELVALCLTIRDGSSLEKKRLGGILLNSADANITLAARDPIALNTARGVFVNTEDLNIEENQLYSGTITAAATISASLANKMRSQETFKSSDGSLSKWGIANKDGELAGDYVEGSLAFENDPYNNNINKSLTGFLQYRISQSADNSAVSFKYNYDTDDMEAGQIMQKRFIANQTEHIINVANYGTDLFKGQKYNIAYSFVYSTAPKKYDDGKNEYKGITQMRMRTKDDANALNISGEGVYQPSKTGFIVDVFGAAANDHSITLRAHSEEKATTNDTNYKKPSSWLNLSKDVAELSVAKDDTQKQMIRANNNNILIGIIPNKPNATYYDLKDGLSIADETIDLIKSGQTAISVDEDGDISIGTVNPAENVVRIGKVAIVDDTVIAQNFKSPDTNGGFIDIGGVIKIVQGDSKEIKKQEDKKDEKKEEKREEVYDDGSENPPID